MTWISLVCLLALSSSAFGQNGYGGGYGGSKILSAMREPLTRTFSSGYDQTNEMFPSTRSASMEENSGMSSVSLPSPFPSVEILTPADQLCIGQLPETVIPIDNNRKFVVCLDDGKGNEQSCPKGLFYHTSSLRCERRLGPLEDVCASRPCLNGGQCFAQDSTFQCQCPSGSSGKTCELDSRVCETQQPCGLAPNARCQSFRWGAALSYICLFDDDEAYGLSSNQIIPSPCADNGPLALSVSSLGFIMCNGGRMHVESCPGGTLWDDINKACDWDGTQIIPSHPPKAIRFAGYGQQTRVAPSNYGGYGQQTRVAPSNYGGYGQQTRVAPSNYGGETKVFSNYGETKVIQPTYGGETRVLQPNYGGETRVLQPNYGGETKVLSNYGGETKVLQPNYGGETRVLQPNYGGETKVLSNYGETKVIQPNYGGETRVLQPNYGGETKVLSNYGETKVIQPTYGETKVIQPTYGGETKVIESNYGGETKVIQPTYGGETKVIQPTYGGQAKLIDNYGSTRTIFPKFAPSYGAQKFIPVQKLIQSSY